MLQRIMFTMLAVVAVSFGSTGFAETKAAPAKAKAAAPAKKPAKPAAAVNPLLGKWVGDNGGSGLEVIFTADKATFTAYVGESGNARECVMTYKYSKSPLALQYKDENGKLFKVSLSYKITGDTLSYRFMKAPADMAVEIYKKRTPEGWGPAIEISVKKREEEKAPVLDENSH
jgi:hypothetical protein